MGRIATLGRCDGDRRTVKLEGHRAKVYSCRAVTQVNNNGLVKWNVLGVHDWNRAFNIGRCACGSCLERLDRAYARRVAVAIIVDEDVVGDSIIEIPFNPEATAAVFINESHWVNARLTD